MHLITEEDVRSKVVTVWLAQHGFAPTDFAVEKSFEVRLGRRVLTIDSRLPDNDTLLRPRADVLVRHVDGRNLLLIEVKRPGESLDEEAREQGLSYARLLRMGGIAPFVILTDGFVSKIYDALSGELVDNVAVPVIHPHVSSQFRVSSNDQEIREIALQSLLMLSPANLVAFCEEQCRFRMRRLRSDDVFSGFKYIPRLYVDRPKKRQELERMLREPRRVILVAGRPQIGKTNFVCHVVEQRLREGLPTLFFPAFDVGGLLDELSDDFEWTFRQNQTANVAERLVRVARTSGQRLVIFIDGWNEAAVDAARSIDAAVARLASEHVSFVVSLTDVAASRLMIDGFANPSSIAVQSGVSATDVLDHRRRVEVRPGPAGRGESVDPVNRVKNGNVLYLGEYEEAEAIEAWDVCSAVYDVRINLTHKQIRDPLLIRTAAAAYAGRALPANLHAPELLGEFVDAKLRRANFRQVNVGRMLLSAVAQQLFAQGAPAPELALLAPCNLSIADGLPNELFEAALLARRDREYSADVDFYSERERDYVVGYLARRWDQRLPGLAAGEMDVEVADAMRTEVGRNALTWFLEQADNRLILRHLLDSLHRHSASTFRALLLRCLVGVLGREGSHLFDRGASKDLSDTENLRPWVEMATGLGLADGDRDVRRAAAKCVIGWVDIAYDEDSVALPVDASIVRLLLASEPPESLRHGGAAEQVLDALRSLHSANAWDDFDRESPLTAAIVSLLDDELVAERALLALGHVAPHVFLRWLRERLRGKRRMPREEAVRYVAALENAVGRMRETLYYAFDRNGGLIDIFQDRDPDDRDMFQTHRREFKSFRLLYEPVIRHFEWHPAGEALRTYLVELRPPEDFARSQRLRGRVVRGRRQLSLLPK